VSPTKNVGKTIGADLRLLTFDGSAAACRKAVVDGLKGQTNYPASASACVVPDAGRHDDIVLAKGMALNNGVFAADKQIGSGSAVALGYNCTQNNTTSMTNPVGGRAETLAIKIFTSKTSKGKNDSKTLRATLTGVVPLPINATLTINITRKSGKVTLSFALPHQLLMPLEFTAGLAQGPPANTGVCAALVDAKLKLDKTSASVKSHGKTTKVGLLTTSSTSCPTSGSSKGKFSVSNTVKLTDGTVMTPTDPKSDFVITRTKSANATAKCKA
jgi:hypothetical protein